MNPPPQSASARGYRLGLVGLVVGTFALLVRWPDAMVPLGIGLPGDRWFIDIYALLASSDAFALGLDPYKPNPLDWLHVPHWYSDWWFWLHDFGLTRAEAPILGVAIGIGYVVAALALVRPRDFATMLTGWLAICSPVALLVVNRANPDSLIFTVFVGVSWLLTQPARPAWLLGPPLIALMAGIKFYPLAGALALPFAPRVRREVWASLALMTVLAVLLAIGLHDDVRRVATLIEAPREFYAFGGAQLFTLAGVGARGAFLLTVGGGAVLAAVWWWRAPAPAARLPDRDRVAFVLGAAVVVGCFFVGGSYSYRLVFALLMLPLLDTLRRDPEAPAIRRLARVGWWGVLVLGWFDGGFCLGWNLTLGAFDPVWTSRIWQAAFVANALLSWLWIGAISGLLVGLVRPRVTQLAARGGGSP